MNFFEFPSEFLVEITHKHDYVVRDRVEAERYDVLEDKVMKILFSERLRGNLAGFKCSDARRDNSRPRGGGRMYESIRSGVWELRVTQIE